MKTLLSIDLSSNLTGYALFNIDTKELVHFGFIKGKTIKDKSKWRATLKKMEYMANEISNIVNTLKPTAIVVEEISGNAMNRIGQKTLDMTHACLWKAIDPWLDIVEYCDVTGATGWRTLLGLKLNDADKAANKEAKVLNKQIAKGVTKLPIIGPKHLSARYVNKTFGLALDVDERDEDADQADAIALGSYFIKRY